MRKVLSVILLLALVVPVVQSQQTNPNNGFTDFASVSVGRTRPAMDFGYGKPHPFYVEGRHWTADKRIAERLLPKPSTGTKLMAALLAPVTMFSRDKTDPCDSARKRYTANGLLPMPGSLDDQLGCGRQFYTYLGENLTTSAGETAISQVMGATAAPPATGNYVALTNTAITPAVADTTLSGEIATNGLARAQGAFTDTSAAIGAPPTPNTPTTIGTTGAATLFYWVFSCTYQGCTAVGTSSTLTTANATLTTSNYVSVTWTGKLGSAWYVVIRTQGAGAPSGAIAGGATQATTGQVQNQPFCTASAAGTAPTCTIYDQSNTTNAGQFGPNGSSTTVPAADQTFVGKYTITKTFTATGTQSAQAFGIFNASSAGTLFFDGTFTSASLVTNDTLAFTETVYH